MNKLALIIISLLVFIFWPVNITTVSAYDIWYYFIIDYCLFILLWLIPAIIMYKKKMPKKYYITLILINIFAFMILWYLWEKEGYKNNKITIEKVKELQEKVNNLN